MSAFAGPLVIAAALLAIAGAQKVLDPRHTVGALRALGVRVSNRTVRAGAAVELAIGVTALATGNRVAVVLVAVSYVAFAVFVETARRRGTMIGSCGCLGSRDTPPSLVHVVLDLALAAGAVAYAVRHQRLAVRRAGRRARRRDPVPDARRRRHRARVRSAHRAATRAGRGATHTLVGLIGSA